MTTHYLLDPFSLGKRALVFNKSHWTFNNYIFGNTLRWGPQGF